MGFLKSLSKFFTPPAPRGRFLVLRAECLRCGEIVSGQVNYGNDLSSEFSESGKKTYVCRKVLIGSGAQHCFQQIEVNLTFDENYKVLDQQITGGKLLEPAPAGK